MKKIIKDALILFAITLIAGAILAVVYNITKDPISDAEKKAEDDAFSVVCPDGTTLRDAEFKPLDAEDTTVTVEKIKAILDADGNTVGYAVKAVNSKGYGGDVVLAVGIDNDLTVIGMKVISASNESPGLGANCLEEDFASQYAGKTEGIEVSKTGAKDNEIDAISGATITSTAVTDAVNHAIECVKENFFTGGDPQ